MAKKILNTFIGIFIGAVFLVLTFKDKSLSDIFTGIKDADLTWVAVNGLCLFVTFFLRSYRWKVLIENTGEVAKTSNVFYSVILGYTVNSFTPKLGEIVRCVSLKKTDNIKTSLSFGTVVTERIYDLIVLAAGIMFCFIFEIDKLVSLFRKTLLDNGIINFDKVYKVLFTFIVLFLLLAGIYYIFRKVKILMRLKLFVSEIFHTVKRSFKIRKYKLFVILTISIWLVLSLMNYACLKALPSTQGYSFYFAAIILFIAGIGWALPSPGGIGTTHFFILQLFIAFNLDENSGLEYGVLSNGLTMVFTWFIGLVAIIVGFVRKLLYGKADFGDLSSE